MKDKYNLIYNGKLDGSDGWNVGGVFSLSTSVTHDSSDGSLYAVGNQWEIAYPEKIQINTADTYTFEFDVMSTATANSYCYSYLPMYDKYGNNISVLSINHFGDTTLAAQLKNGDTTATVTNATGLYENIKQNYNVFGIADSLAWGYDKYLVGQYFVASATNTSTKVIKFASAWTGGTWAAGTPVARYRAGNTYTYPALWNSMTLNTWQHKTYTITPSLWRFGTISMNVGQSVATNWKMYLTNFKLTNITELQEREYNGTTFLDTNESRRANIERTAVANCDSVREVSTQNVRYIRDFCSGSTANNANHWCEIQAWDKYGRNVAFGSVGSATTRDGVLSLISSVTKSGTNNSSNENYIKTHAVTKGTHSPASTYIGLGATLGIIIDLGQVFEIETIKIWHYWGDERTYHKVETQISEDGVNWKTVFDSSVRGEYKETESGLTIDFNETTMSITRAGIYKTNILYEI